jgi:hypothetical protein
VEEDNHRKRCESDMMILSRGSTNAYSMLWWPPSFKDYTQSFSSDPTIKLEYHDFLPFIKCFPLWGISTSWSLSPLQDWSQLNHKSKRGIETHTRTRVAATACTQVKTWAHKTMQQSHDSNKCSNLNHNEPNACLQSLGILECSMEAWCTAPCA